MADPEELKEALAEALRESDAIPDGTYLTEEADAQGNHSNLRLPLYEITVASSTWLDEHNTDFIGFVEDEDENEVGRIYDSEYQMTLQVEIWTAAGSRHDIGEISSGLRRALYPYESSGLDQPLPHPDGGEVTDVWRFSVGDGGRNDDLTMSPSLRRWTQDVEVWSFERFNTSEPTIEEVVLREVEEVVLPGDEMAAQ